MEPFITSTQYNFIKAQTKILINAHATSNDMNVKKAVIDRSHEKVLHLFNDISDVQQKLLYPIRYIKTNADDFLQSLESYVIPFKMITEQNLKKLFPKAKKLKIPSLENNILKEISYLGWYDKGTSKKFIIAYYRNKLVGLHGTVNSLNKKGICALCNGYEELELFLSEQKGEEIGTYIKRGNYICQDSQKCNQNLITLDRLYDFIDRLNSK